MENVVETITAVPGIDLQLRERTDGRVEIYRPDYDEVLDDFDNLEDAKDAAKMIANEIAWSYE